MNTYLYKAGNINASPLKSASHHSYEYFKMFYCQICIVVAGFVLLLSDLLICVFNKSGCIYIFIFSICINMSCCALPILCPYCQIYTNMYPVVLPALDLYYQIYINISWVLSTLIYPHSSIHIHTHTHRRIHIHTATRTNTHIHTNPNK